MTGPVRERLFMQVRGRTPALNGGPEAVEIAPALRRGLSAVFSEVGNESREDPSRE